MKPIVAIVGRPNVGKSTLFNRIAGRRQAIVNDMAGVTRDRQYANAEWERREFVLVDTGGLIRGVEKSIQAFIEKQTMAAVEEAHVIVCVLDGKEGPVSADKSILDILRRARKPVIFVVNKLDADIGQGRKKTETMILPDVSVFYELGISTRDKFFAISAEHGRGIDDLLDEIVKTFPDEDSVSLIKQEDEDLKIAVIGRPNAGKSTLVNHLFGSERVIAHEMPGTTRDSIDVEIVLGNKKYIFIDTAGLKKRGKTIETLDKYSAIKTLASIESARIVILMVDSNEGFTHQDSFLLDYAYSAGKGVIIAFNKWDALTMDASELEKFYAEKLLRLHPVPYLCISARTGLNIKKLFKEIDRLKTALETRLSTPEMNKLLKDVQASHNIPSFKGKSVKFYYATQVNVNPPAFIIFTNFPEGVGASYQRFIKNRLLDVIGAGVPVKLVFKKK